MTVPVVLLLLAVAVLIAPGAAGSRRRLRRPDAPARGESVSVPVLPVVAAAGCACAAIAMGGRAGAVVAPLVAVLAYLLSRRMIRDGQAIGPVDPLALAGAWDLAAACLRAGLPVAVAVRAGAGAVPSSAAGLALHRCTELLALGADPDQVWQPALACPDTAAFARAARRSAHSGSALADSLTGLALDLRADVGRRSEARAQRAGVLIAGPLGLCFLPAFLLVGVVPVVIGLADRVLTAW